MIPPFRERAGGQAENPGTRGLVLTHSSTGTHERGQHPIEKRSPGIYKW